MLQQVVILTTVLWAVSFTMIPGANINIPGSIPGSNYGSGQYNIQGNYPNTNYNNPMGSGYPANGGYGSGQNGYNPGMPYPNGYGSGGYPNYGGGSGNGPTQGGPSTDDHDSKPCQRFSGEWDKIRDKIMSLKDNNDTVTALTKRMEYIQGVVDQLSLTG